MKRSINIASLLILTLCVIAVCLIVDVAPTVNRSVHSQVQNAENVTEIISQLRKSLRNRYQPQQIDITYSQAESLLGFTQRVLPNVSSELKLFDEYAEILVSYQLPSYFFSYHINLSLRLNEAERVDVDSLSIGAITIPGSWALSWAESLANSYTNSDIATKAIQQIAKTDINPSKIIVSLNPLDALLRELKNIKTSGDGNEKQLLRIKTAHYLRLLDSLPLPSGSNRSLNKDTSLSYYLNKVMLEAKAMSTQGTLENSNSATLENEAAIMAVAIYVGHRRFSTFVGDLTFAVDPIPTIRNKPVLAGRKDLSLHFIFSAAIKLLSEQGVSVAVGEFKELMDRGRGGSGYSFVDLTADMAGANFAALAVDPRTALQIQNIMSLESNENTFFPAINGFEEGMSKSEFKRKYSDIESDKYTGVVEEIESRLRRLPIGQLLQ